MGVTNNPKKTLDQKGKRNTEIKKIRQVSISLIVGIFANGDTLPNTVVLEKKN